MQIARLLTLICLPLILVSSADAAIIVGDDPDAMKYVGVNDVQQTTASNMNNIVSEWNNTFGPGTTDNLSPLPPITTSLGKFDSGDGWTSGTGSDSPGLLLNPGDFTFFRLDDNGDRTATLNGVDRTLSAIDPQSGVFSQQIVAIEYTGFVQIDFYAVKSATEAALWKWTTDTEDDGNGNLILTNPAFIAALTQGGSASGDLASDPWTSTQAAISHLEFYSSFTPGEIPGVPEPSSVLLFGLGAVGLAGLRFRRRLRGA